MERQTRFFEIMNHVLGALVIFLPILHIAAHPKAGLLTWFQLVVAITSMLAFYVAIRRLLSRLAVLVSKGADRMGPLHIVRLSVGMISTTGWCMTMMTSIFYGRAALPH